MRPGNNAKEVSFCSPEFQGDFNFSKSTGVLNFSDGQPFDYTYPRGAFGTFTLYSDSSNAGVWPPKLATNATEDSFSFAAAIFDIVEKVLLDDVSPLEDDPEIFYSYNPFDHGSLYYLFGCKTTVYNMTYSYVNETVLAQKLIPSDRVAGAIPARLIDGPIVTLQLSYPAISTTARSNSSGQIAVNYARDLERLPLAFSAAIWDPLTNTDEQVRENLLVARVPKAPPFTLILLCLLCVMLDIPFFVLALSGQSAEAQEVQTRLGIFGITASRFENPLDIRVDGVEDLFAEPKGGSSTKLGIAKSEAGVWTYVSALEEVTPGGVSFWPKDQGDERDD